MRPVTRRSLFKAMAAIAVGRAPLLARTQTAAAIPGPLSASVLPPSVRSRFVDNVNGLRMHVLEAGFETPGRQAVLMIHGFPELAYSWRNVLGPIAAAGYHVFAPDARGYGRTSGADVVKYIDDLRPFGTV